MRHIAPPCFKVVEKAGKSDKSSAGNSGRNFLKSSGGNIFCSSLWCLPATTQHWLLSDPPRSAPASCPSCPCLNPLGFLCPHNPGCSWCTVHSLRCLLAFCFQTVPCLLLPRHVLRLSAATKPGKEMLPTFVLKINREKEEGPEVESKHFQWNFACFSQARRLFWKWCVTTTVSGSSSLKLLRCSMPLKWHELASQIFEAQTDLRFCKKTTTNKQQQHKIFKVIAPYKSFH